MTFTSAEETLLRQLIEAFQNGKRLSDLPDVKGTNPYDLLVEVLDTDGESKKAVLAALLPYAEDTFSYGVSRTMSVTTPECRRIGASDLHKSLPIQSRMKGCLLDDNGNVVEYLNPKDWTGHTRDGSRGQVMVEIPLHYRKFNYVGGDMSVRFSELPLPGYHQVPKMYASAYEASLQRSTQKLSSVVNTSEDYRGGANQSAWDGTYRSLLGMPVTGISRTNLRQYARKRNDGDSRWNLMTYEAQKALYWLFVVEYATLNSQAAYNHSLTAEGFRQGGLGAGVSNLSDNDWWDLSTYNPFIPCGYTDSLGNNTGVVEFTMPNEYGTGQEFKTAVPRYRGVENPFGHIGQWTDGINVRSFGGQDGLSKVFVSKDPAKFNDTNYDGYSHVGNEARMNGYVNEIIGSEFGEIIPAAVGGGSTTHFCDFHTTEYWSDETLFGVYFGGDAIEGADCGFVCTNTRKTPGWGHNRVGTRLCFHP